MRVVHFDRDQAISVVDVKVVGPLRSTTMKLVFDTGAQFTMVDTAAIEHIGYSARDGTVSASVQGATDERQSGYMLRVSQFVLFGLRFSDLIVGAFDGPNGVLRILGST